MGIPGRQRIIKLPIAVIIGLGLSSVLNTGGRVPDPYSNKVYLVSGNPDNWGVPQNAARILKARSELFPGDAEFTKWVKKREFEKLRDNHFDWWMFPWRAYPWDSEKGVEYSISVADGRQLIEDPEFMKKYVFGINALIAAEDAGVKAITGYQVSKARKSKIIGSLRFFIVVARQLDMKDEGGILIDLLDTVQEKFGRVEEQFVEGHYPVFDSEPPYLAATTNLKPKAAL